MDELKIKELKFWIKDAKKDIDQDRHQFCIKNNIKYEDYYPFLTGMLKSTIKHLEEIIENN